MPRTSVYLMSRHQTVSALSRLTFVAAAIVLTACGGSDDTGKFPLNEMGRGASGAGPTVLPAGLTAASAANLDSGNVAFRMRNYEDALRFYRTASREVPNHPAPWYGIMMVAQATGNTALSDSATTAVSARSGGGELLESGNVMTHKAVDVPSAHAGVVTESAASAAAKVVPPL